VGGSAPEQAPSRKRARTHEPVVLVDGDDPTLVADAVRGLVDELVGDRDRALVVEEIRAEEADLAVVADGCATPPFLTDRRIVVLRGIGRFSTDEVGPLLGYLDHPLDTTVLVLAAGDGTIAPKLTAAVKSKGRVVSTRVTGRAADWIRDRARRAPVKLDSAAEDLLASHLGEDVGRLGTILDVLVSAYGDGAELGTDQVRPYLGEPGALAPWSFTDAIDAGETEEALAQLRRLLVAGERHPLVILATLHRHVQSLLRVDGPEIRTEVQAAAAMGIAPGRSTFPAKKALRSAGRWGSARIAEAIDLVARAELDLKGASAWPPEAVLEVLVARLCRLARAGGQARSGRAVSAPKGGSRSRTG
jgi:DNA polymerase-3 subunit delta